MSRVLKPLSKYPFLRARDCVKALYLQYWYPGLASEADAEQKMNFSVGNKVGLIGRQIHPGGVDLSDDNRIWGKKLLEKTLIALKGKQSVFYEAAFTTPCKQFVCRVDIFKKEKSRNVIVEVKSSTELSFPDHILDVGFQYKILKEALPDKPLVMYLAYLNKDYVRGKSLDVNKLFTVVDVTRQAKAVQEIIEKYINIFSKVLRDEYPYEVDIGQQCTKPYKCPFYDYCWKDVPEYSIWNLSQIRKSKAEKLFHSGLIEPEQIPRETNLTEKQWIEVDAAITQKPYLRKESLAEFIKDLEMKNGVYFMDFETMMPAIPLYENTRCYQHLCFQYSILFKNENRKWVRREFLAEPGRDPRKKFIEQLLTDTKKPGNIVVYNKNFECSRLKELAKLFPEHKEAIDDRINRIKDLLVPFTEHHYYHPEFAGKFSLKNVLPVLCPDFAGYKNLKITNGTMAMEQYENLQQLPINEQQETEKALKEYCNTDTLAMVKILEVLIKTVKEK